VDTEILLELGIELDIVRVVQKQISPPSPRGSHKSPLCGWMPTEVHPSKANQSSAVLETHHIPLTHTGWMIPLLVRAISLEQSVPETLLFGAPAFHFTLRTRLPSLLPAPVYASDERDAGIFLTLKVKGITRRTTRTRLLQIVDILPPGW